MAAPSQGPAAEPTGHPSVNPTIEPTAEPTYQPTNMPTDQPTIDPTTNPTVDPTVDPTRDPTADPIAEPTLEQSSEPDNGPIQRDCGVFAIDEYLDQCSAIFPATVGDMTASMEGVTATVQVIQNTDLPAVTALSESNSANIADLAETVSVIHDSRIPGIASEATALDERLALMETRVRGFETSSAKTSSAQYDQAPNKYQQLYAQYKDDLVLVLLASNLALMTYVACSCRSSRKVKHAEVCLSSEAEGALAENEELL